MIDKTKKFWTGNSATDIDEYLRLYSELDELDVHPVICHTCGKDVFALKLHGDEGVIRVTCAECRTQKILLDGEELWHEVRTKNVKCKLCGCKHYNIRIGFHRRENGDVKWVYSGERCVQCEVLSSYADWPVNYGPTAEMEKNI